jgi:hypothetical protein
VTERESVHIDQKQQLMKVIRSNLTSPRRLTILRVTLWFISHILALKRTSNTIKIDRNRVSNRVSNISLLVFQRHVA